MSGPGVQTNGITRRGKHKHCSGLHVFVLGLDHPAGMRARSTIARRVEAFGMVPNALRQSTV